MHITMNIQHSTYHSSLFIPIEYFTASREKIVKELCDFVIAEITEKVVEIKLPKSLAKKTLYSNIVHKGMENIKDKSCIFCSKRVRCLTTNWECTGFEVGKSYDKSLEEIQAIFSDIPIIATKVE